MVKSGKRTAYTNLDRFIDDRIKQLYTACLPSTVYHYTGWEGFTGILRERALRATDYRDLADPSEFRLADSMVLDLAHELARRLRSRPPARAALERFIEDYDRYKLSARPDVFNIYLTCFCIEPELPHLWRSFGRQGYGVCIGIRSVPGEKHGDMRVSGGALQVEYDIDRLRTKVDREFQAILRTLAQHPAGQARRPLELAWNGLFQIAAFANIASKAPEYRDEREWRLGIWPRPEGHTLELVDTGPRRYVVWPVRPERRPIILESVHVGAHNGAAGLARAEHVLLELGYGSSDMPPMPSIELSEVEFESIDEPTAVADRHEPHSAR